MAELPLGTTARLIARIVSVYVAKNPLPASELPTLIAGIHASLDSVATPIHNVEPQRPPPAVAIKKSITPDYIVCLEDGKKFKSLKGHLARSYGMTPAAYRARWDLPVDYPMVAPNYSAKRSALAKAFRLRRSAVAPKQDP